MARCQQNQLDAPAVKEGVAADEECVWPLASIVANAASISLLVLARMMWICRPTAPEAACTSLSVVSAFTALPGLIRTAPRTALGTSSCNRSKATNEPIRGLF